MPEAFCSSGGDPRSEEHECVSSERNFPTASPVQFSSVSSRSPHAHSTTVRRRTIGDTDSTTYARPRTRRTNMRRRGSPLVVFYRGHLVTAPGASIPSPARSMPSRAPSPSAAPPPSSLPLLVPEGARDGASSRMPAPPRPRPRPPRPPPRPPPPRPPRPLPAERSWSVPVPSREAGRHARAMTSSVVMASDLMRDANKRSSEIIRGHPRPYEAIGGDGGATFPKMVAPLPHTTRGARTARAHPE